VPGPYKTDHASISPFPNLSTGKPNTASIWYPTGTNKSMTFPFLSFAHGADEGGVLPNPEYEYEALLKLVASYGFIIIVPDSCIGMCYDYYKDQLSAIATCRKNTSLHPILQQADFTKVGVFGHSMGAMASLIAAGALSSVNPKDYNIKGAVSMHPCGFPLNPPHPELISVPILFTAGSADVVCEDDCAYSFYKKITKTDRIYLDISGIGHMDPCTGGDMHEHMVVTYFLTCTVRNEHCDAIWGGSGKQICTQKFSIAKCELGNSSAVL